MMMALPRVQYGSTVLNPGYAQEDPRIQRQEEKRERETQKEYTRRTAMRNNKIRKSVMMTILFMAVASFITIYRGGMIYSMQNQYVSMQSETKTLNKENEDLRAQLIKASSINDIVAKSQAMALVSVSQDSVIRVDLSKNNFKSEESVTAKASLPQKILAYLNQQIFN